MNTVITFLVGAFNNFGPFFILLGILIFVHELGHFLVAKYFGVRVEVFSLGFGKKILSYKRGDTNYCLSLIPLGGYVKMYGDDPSANIPESERKFAFTHKPVSQRFAVVLAGPLMNLFFAIFIFSAIALIGENVPGPFVGDTAEDSKAYEAGLRSGDKIVRAGDSSTATWGDVQKQVQLAGGKVLSLQVERQGISSIINLDANIGFGENENIFSSDREVGQLQGLSPESRSTYVGIRGDTTPAGAAGIPSLSLITTVNGTKVTYWRDLATVIKNTTDPASQTLTIQWRDLEKPDTPENNVTAKVTLPKGWQQSEALLSDLGIESAELYIFQVKKDSPADKAGMKSKDRLVRIADKEITAWNDVLNQVKTYDVAADRGLEFVIERNGIEQAMKVKPEMTTLMTSTGKEEHRFTIGIGSGLFPVGPKAVFRRSTNPIDVLKYGLTETVYWTEFVVMSMVRLVQGEVSAKNIGGVITIGRVAAHSFEAGMTTFLKMMGLISINLFLLNLLPIPILDGGHLVFYSIEALRGAPLSMRKMEIAQQVGLMLLMFLMAFAFFNDISNLWINRM